MTIERIQPDGLPKPTAYTHVVKHGNLVFLAGQTAADSSGNVVGVGDFEAQANQVYENIKIALAVAGSDVTKIVKTTTYLTRREDIDGYRKARERHIPTDLPASTLLFISGLASPDYLIEIDIVAALD
jgi:2-iminobutanoate/2-iminopropanoate deaminase